MRRILIISVILLLLGGAAWVFVMAPRTNDSDQSGNTGGFRSFFSLGEKSTDPSTEDTRPDDGMVGMSEEVLPVGSPFSRVGFGPVAGYAYFSIEKNITTPSIDSKQNATSRRITEHYLRYVSRTNGYIYEIKDGGTPVQISNVYIPNVYEATFADNNKTVILRFLRADGRTIATHSVPIPDQNADGTRTQIPGTYFSDDISSLAVSPDGKSIVHAVSNGTETVIASTTAKNLSRRELLRTPFNSWILLWPAKDIYLQTKASASAEGFLYRLDSTNKRLIRILGNINGLTVSMSPSGSYILYSESDSDSFSTTLLNLKSGMERRLSERVLPEKCVWLKNDDLICAGNDSVESGAYPDAWYAGTIGFDDKLYRIFSSIGAVDILDQGEPGSYDAVQLSIDESSRRLYFIDKRTGFLWQFDY